MRRDGKIPLRLVEILATLMPKLMIWVCEAFDSFTPCPTPGTPCACPLPWVFQASLRSREKTELP